MKSLQQINYSICKLKEEFKSFRGAKEMKESAKSRSVDGTFFFLSSFFAGSIKRVAPMRAWPSFYSIKPFSDGWQVATTLHCAWSGLTGEDFLGPEIWQRRGLPPDPTTDHLIQTGKWCNTCPYDPKKMSNWLKKLKIISKYTQNTSTKCVLVYQNWPQESGTNVIYQWFYFQGLRQAGYPNFWPSGGGMRIRLILVVIPHAHVWQRLRFKAAVYFGSIQNGIFGVGGWGGGYMFRITKRNEL